METEKHYFKVGLFVLLGMLGLAAVIVWLGFRGEDRDFEKYAIYFQGDVSGIKVGSAVKFKGIDVGNVLEIAFDRRSADYIRVLVRIDDTAPIGPTTVASTRIQDVIGTTAITLANMDPMPDNLVALKSERYKVIPSKSSDFEKIITSLPEMTETIKELGDQAKKLMSDENIAAITQSIASLDHALGTLDATLGNVNGTVNQSKTLFDKNMVTEVRDTMAEARNAIREVKMLARSLREDPSQLIKSPKYEGYRTPDAPK